MMLEMVRDINANFGDGKTHVTCWNWEAVRRRRLAKRPQAASTQTVGFCPVG